MAKKKMDIKHENIPIPLMPFLDSGIKYKGKKVDKIEFINTTNQSQNIIFSIDNQGNMHCCNNKYVTRVYYSDNDKQYFEDVVIFN